MDGDGWSRSSMVLFQVLGATKDSYFGVIKHSVPENPPFIR
jgi:hypothetical protein